MAKASGRTSLQPDPGHGDGLRRSLRRLPVPRPRAGRAVPECAALWRLGPRPGPSRNRHRHRSGCRASRRSGLLRRDPVQVPGDRREHPEKGNRLLPRGVGAFGVPPPCLDRHDRALLVAQCGRDPARAGEAGAADRPPLSQGKPHRLGRICFFRGSCRTRAPEDPAAAPAGRHRQRPCTSRRSRHARQAADGLRHGQDACRAPDRRAHRRRWRSRSRPGAEPGAPLANSAGVARRRHVADTRLRGVLRQPDRPAAPERRRHGRHGRARSRLSGDHPMRPRCPLAPCRTLRTR